MTRIGRLDVASRLLGSSEMHVSSERLNTHMGQDPRTTVLSGQDSLPYRHTKTEPQHAPDEKVTGLANPPPLHPQKILGAGHRALSIRRAAPQAGGEESIGGPKRG